MNNEQLTGEQKERMEKAAKDFKKTFEIVRPFIKKEEPEKITQPARWRTEEERLSNISLDK